MSTSPAFEENKQILERAGVSLDQLVAATAQFFREHPTLKLGGIESPLTKEEIGFLQRAGAEGVLPGKASGPVVRKRVLDSAAEYAAMVSEALPQKAVAERLLVTPARVRQRIDENTLYVIATSQGRVCPLWQFTESSTIPGLEIVLKAIDPDTHPLAIHRFFTNPNVDLEDQLGQGQQLTPREWLLTGHSPQTVAALIQNI